MFISFFCLLSKSLNIYYFRKCSCTYECELFGDYVEIFRELMKDTGLGLPVVALQWVKVTKSQGYIYFLLISVCFRQSLLSLLKCVTSIYLFLFPGRSVVQSVDGITKIYVNPTFYDACQFRDGYTFS
jgi:hypothetical protein